MSDVKLLGGAELALLAAKTETGGGSMDSIESSLGFDENYSFGGLPTGQGGKFTSSEIPEAMAEINEGRVQAAQLEKDQKQAAG